MLIETQILCWNCRGAQSDTFLRELKEIMRSYRPEILILLEPKINEEAANVACKKMGKTHWISSKAEGFSGGVWLLWDEAEIQIELRYAHKFFLHVTVNLNGVSRWELSAIYASPNLSARRSLWSKLNELQIEYP